MDLDDPCFVPAPIEALQAADDDANPAPLTNHREADLAETMALAILHLDTDLALLAGRQSATDDKRVSLVTSLQHVKLSGRATQEGLLEA